jgi:uncharacterized protein
MSLEHLHVDCEMKADDAEGAEAGTVLGYGSVFNNVDLGKDVVLPGAFAGTAVRKVRMLWQHDPRQPIGVWDELEEDAKGLRLKGRLALGTRLGAEVYELLKMGALDGLSIGFTMSGPKDFEYDPKTDIRRIKRVKLMEVSLVTFPMNPRATTTRVKSATSKRDLEQSLRDAGLSASEAKYVAGLTQLPAVSIEAPEAPSVTPDDGNEAAVQAASLLAALRNLNTAAFGRA